MAESSIQTSGQLFELVQTLRLFGDSKTFVDSLPLRDNASIERELDAFLAQFLHIHPELGLAEGGGPAAFLIALPDDHPARAELAQQLKDWVLERFMLQARSMEEHIEAMWSVLERRSPQPPAGSSLIALPNPYIVAGGRYLESYYWDSYFTCLGLAVAGRVEMLRATVDNFAHLIRQFGYIPNGTRTYYLGRSQPPFFAQLVRLLEISAGPETANDYFEELAREHVFWMDENGGRRVQLAAQVLNRDWDSHDTPRPEGYAEDVQTAREVGVAGPYRAHLYRDLRAAAESGWDFSSRWIAPDQDGHFALARVHTTQILPVDLNALLYSQERILADFAARRGDAARAETYRANADARKTAILARFWDADAGWFFDYDYVAEDRTQVWSLAGIAPLFCGVLDASLPAEREIVRRVRNHLVERFLRKGGVVTTLNRTGQQWDMPNGWAPLQWIAAVGLLKYGYSEDAHEIAARFSRLARRVHAETGKMMEKYDVCDPDRPGGGGEYPNQEGFGWTNGVVSAFLDLLDKGSGSLAARLLK